MKWYSKYLEVYEKPFAEAPKEPVELVKKRLKELTANEPVIASVILICYNEEKRLLSCLWSLCENKCNFPIEILAINNNSSDHTEKVLQELGTTYFNETQKGPGYARQCGLNHARGKYHLCIDADTMYPPHYLETHLKQLSKPGVIGTFSLWSFIPDGRSRIGLWAYETLRDTYLTLQAIKRPELCIRGMAFGFDTELARKFGFRTDIIRGEDGSIALAMKPFGKLVFIHSRKARVITGYGTLNTEGGLCKSFTKRIGQALEGFGGLFTKKTNYIDEDKNLINKKK